MSLTSDNFPYVLDFECGYDIIHLNVTINMVGNHGNIWKDDFYHEINDKCLFEDVLAWIARNLPFDSITGRVTMMHSASANRRYRCLLLMQVYSHGPLGKRWTAADFTGVRFDAAERSLRTIGDRLRKCPAAVHRSSVVADVVLVQFGGPSRSGGDRPCAVPRVDTKANRCLDVPKDSKKKSQKSYAIDSKPVKMVLPSLVPSENCKSKIKTNVQSFIEPVKTSITESPIEKPLVLDDFWERRVRDQLPNAPEINITSKNIWEINCIDTDIILFIDMENMYMDDWKNEVVDRVDKKFPFKDRFLADIDLVPVAPGAVRVYPEKDVIIFCAFMSNGALFSEQMEDALWSIKRWLSGRIHLAIQNDPSFLKLRPKISNSLRHLFRWIFRSDEVTVWLCGNTESENDTISK